MEMVAVACAGILIVLAAIPLKAVKPEYSLLLSLAGTFIGSLLGIFGSARMTNFRLEQLEKKVEKHNQVVERMAVAENAIKSAHHRLDDVNSELEHIKGGT